MSPATFLLSVLLLVPNASEPAIAPHDALVVEGVPPVPAALAEQLQRYASFRRAAFLDWHPTRREMLVSTRLGDTAQVHWVRFPLAARRQLTFFREPVSQQIRFVPGKEDTFVYARDVGGNERFDLFRASVAGGEPTRLTDGSSRNTGLKVSASGKWLAYGSTRRNGKDVDLWVQPSSGGEPRRLGEFSGGGWQPLDFSFDDRELLVKEGLSVNQARLYVVDLATGQRQLLVDDKEEVAYGEALFSKDGKAVYYVCDEGSEFRRLWRLDRASKKRVLVSAPLEHDVEELDLSSDGRRLAYTTNERGQSVLRLVDLKSARETVHKAVGSGVLSGLKFHSAGRELGFTLSTHRGAEAVSLELASGKLFAWTESETGGVDTSRWVEPELVSWKSFDGRDISGFLYRPDPARFPGKRPVAISIHGGPEGQSRPTSLDQSSYYVHELGMAVLLPNVRGSTGYGKTFAKLDNALRRGDSVKDIGALLDWLGTRDDLDSERVLVMGGSYGGYMTLAVATTYPERISAAVDVVGISNLVTFLKTTAGYRQDLRRVEYGDERDPEVRKALEALSPLNHAQRVRRPLFVIQGQNDPRVPASEAQQMVSVIRKSGTPVWFLMAKDEGHGFAKLRNREFQFWSVAMFAQKYVLGPDAQKAAASAPEAGKGAK